MMTSPVLRLFGLLALGLWCSAQLCTRVVAYADTLETDAVVRVYSSSFETVRSHSEKALQKLGYKIQSSGEFGGEMTTGWEPTTPDSHYLDLFGRRDYSANAGTYYQLLVKIVDTYPQIEVAVSTRLKSISGPLKSAEVLEKQFFDKLSTYMRSPQIEITNVGVKER